MSSGKQRDAKATKAKIIRNAMLVFSKNGFDAATMDEIAAESGVNKALLYYYFKNKSVLYEAVISEVLGAIREEVLAANACCSKPLAELEAFIKTYAAYAQKHPYLPALLLRELSDSGAHLPETMFASMRQLFSLLSDILKRGEQEGVFHDAIPMVIHFMIIGTLNLLVTTKPLRQRAAQSDPKIDTCATCSMEEIAEYLFTKIKSMLEKKE